jgi:hypothetical protein
MLKLISYLFIVVLVASACAPTMPVTQQQPTQSTDSKVIIENTYFLTNINAVQPLSYTKDNINVTVSAVDVRKYDSFNRTPYVDGRHFDVYANISLDASQQTTPTNEVNLLKSLDSLGIESNKARDIVRQMFTYNQNDSHVYLFSDDFFTESYNRVIIENPFAFDGRYLTLFELTLVNSTSRHSEYCTPRIIAETSSQVYFPIKKAELMSVYNFPSVEYELVDKLLMPECIIIPPNSEIKRILLFPSVNYNSKYAITFLEEVEVARGEFVVEKSRNNLRAELVPILFEVPAARDQSLNFTTSGQGSTNLGVQTFSMNRFMISNSVFVETPTQVYKLKDELLYLQNNLDLAGYYMIYIERFPGNYYKVDRIRLNRNAIVNGRIRLSL